MTNIFVVLTLIFGCLLMLVIFSVAICVLFSKPEKEDNHVSPGRIAFENRYNN